MLGAWLCLGFAACGSGTGPSEPMGFLELDPSLSISGASLAVEFVPAPVWVVFHNTASAPAAVNYSVCSFLVVAYPTSDRSGPPTWSYLLPRLAGCGADILFSETIAGGASRQVSLGEIPADLMNRPGTNSLSLHYRLKGETGVRSIPIGLITID